MRNIVTSLQAALIPIRSLELIGFMNLSIDSDTITVKCINKPAAEKAEEQLKEYKVGKEFRFYEFKIIITYFE